MSHSLIQNRAQFFPQELSKTQSDLRNIALDALELAINSVMPSNLMNNSLKLEDRTLLIQNTAFDLSLYEEILIIGGGKAAAHMASFLDDLLSKAPEIEHKGIINVPEGLKVDDLSITDSIQINFASHPNPNKAGMDGVRKMKDLVEHCSQKTLIFFLISGGGSALLPFPRNGIDLEDLKKINALLLESGASIQEINIIRKHLSDVKGGNFARTVFNASRATLVSLIISDVVGNDLDSIASGPTVPDRSTFKEVHEVLTKYDLFDKIPSAIRSLVKIGLKNDKLETPKPGDECFEKIHNFLVGSVESAVDAVSAFLKDQKFEVEHLTGKMIGEAKKFGKRLFNDHFFELVPSNVLDKRTALVSTGELTVTVKGKGVGGRNQEMLLSFLESAKRLQDACEFCLLSANLDGIEGNSTAMGALVDNHVKHEVRRLNLHLKKYLNQNDSNSAFKKLGTELITGLTGCNVNDILVLLKEWKNSG